MCGCFFFQYNICVCTHSMMKILNPPTPPYQTFLPFFCSRFCHGDTPGGRGASPREPRSAPRPRSSPTMARTAAALDSSHEDEA